MFTAAVDRPQIDGPQVFEPLGSPGRRTGHHRAEADSCLGVRARIGKDGRVSVDHQPELLRCGSSEWSGIDVSKKTWMWRSGPMARSTRCEHGGWVCDVGGRLRRLGSAKRPELVVVEATGGLEHGVVAALEDIGWRRW